MAITTCNLCGTTRNETLREHLVEHHLNEQLNIEFDPQSETATVLGRVAEPGGAATPAVQLVVAVPDEVPKDHGTDRFDYIEIDGPHDVTRPEWLTPGYVACQDCRANLFLKWMADENRWHVTVAHDEGCPELARHERG